MRFRDREVLLVRSDPVPKGADVTNLLLGRQLVETRGRHGKHAGHDR
jgi:hypothetical protein